jgi:hypothetical protein
VAAVAPLIALIPSGVERGEYCAQVALVVGTEARHVEAAVRQAARGREARDAVPVAPRRQGPEERNVLQLVRSLLDHPQHAQRVSLDEITALVSDRSLAELVRALIEAAREGPRVDVEQIAERLEGETRNLLRALATADSLDAEAASRTIDDTVRWLRRRRSSEEGRALTEKMRDPNADRRALIEAKVRHSRARETSKHPPMGSQP